MSYDTPPNFPDQSLVFNFFWSFSVFECALKRNKFLRQGRDNAAEPDWEKFGESIRGRFSEVHTNGFSDAVEALMKLSPHKQVVKNGQLGWRKICQKPNESKEEFVLRLLRAVRNNLFHGGKYPDGPVTEVARDSKILKAALSILEGCYVLHPNIAKWENEAT